MEAIKKPSLSSSDSFTRKRVTESPSREFLAHGTVNTFMAGQPTPPGPRTPPEIAGLIKGLLTIGFP